jgi:hypothetical protein
LNYRLPWSLRYPLTASVHRHVLSAAARRRSSAAETTNSRVEVAESHRSSPV